MPDKAPVENQWRSGLIGGITGAIGATIVGLIFSSTTLSFIANLFGHNSLPSNAVVFVSGGDCGQAGDGWKPFTLAQGRFLVGAGTNTDHPERTFQSGITNKGTVDVKLEERNLPAIKLSIPSATIGIKPIDLGEFNAVVTAGTKSSDPHAINRDAELPIGGHSDPIDTLPPWIALTACQKSL